MLQDQKSKSAFTRGVVVELPPFGVSCGNILCGDRRGSVFFFHAPQTKESTPERRGGGATRMYTKANLAALRVKKDIAEVRHAHEVPTACRAVRGRREDAK